MENSNENIYSKIIGNGMLFPIKLSAKEDGKTGWYPVQGDTNLIVNNVNSLLTYMIGERFRQENFGTRLWECIEEPNTQAQAFLINEFLKEAIKDWEPRISFVKAEVTRKSNKLHIQMNYKIRNIAQQQSLSITYDNLTNTLT